MFSGHMGNPNPVRQEYRCETCGAPRPPYQFYCDDHMAEAHREKQPLLDRVMAKLLGHR
ncbi:MAG: hypothetical protein AAGF73_03270 [Actinomycetota bacterium]